MNPATRFHLLALVSLVAAFASLGLLAASDSPLPGDTAGIALAQQLDFRPIARFFEGPVNRLILPALAVTGVVVAASQRRADLAFVLAITWPSSMFNTFAKLAVERARPAGDFAILSSPDSWSFPSGHSYLAAAVAGGWLALALAAPPSRGRSVVLVAAPLLAFGAGFSRVWLGVHWPSDVLGAWVLAAVVLLAATALARLLRHGLREGRALIASSSPSSPPELS